MWARTVEVMLGFWMLMAPFVFGHTPDETALWINDLAAGTVIMLLALASWWRPTRHAHAGLLVVALWLIGFAYALSGERASPALQNDAIVGLLLAMFAILPNEADLPPTVWRREARSGEAS